MPSPSRTRPIMMHVATLLLFAFVAAMQPTCVQSTPSQKQYTQTHPQTSSQLRLRYETAAKIKPAPQVAASELTQEGGEGTQAVLHERFDDVKKEYSLSGDGGLIDAFLRDVGLIHETLNTTLTTPCHRLTKYPCDSSYSRIWTNRDWDKRKYYERFLADL